MREIEIPTIRRGRAASGPTQASRSSGISRMKTCWSYGVPDRVARRCARGRPTTHCSQLVDHLPAEAMEALVALATGEVPQLPLHTPEGTDPFAHPDAQRRFRVMANAEELERALDYPWEKWTVFLHPTQRSIVERRYNGPARVAGSAGTGKTVVALHRAVHLARRDRDARVLLTTFSDTLANALRVKLGRLAGSEPRMHERVDIRAIDRVGLELYEAAFGEAHDRRLRRSLRALLRESSELARDATPVQRPLPRDRMAGCGRCLAALVLGGRTGTWRGSVAKRASARTSVRCSGPSSIASSQASPSGSLVTLPGVFARVTEHVEAGGESPYDFVVVDESQDISVPQLRFLAALRGGHENGLFFAGDLGQRIFQTPFSWLSLGVDVRGRSSTLRINYRTSHQIRRQADLLLPPEMSDVDGNTDVRRGTVSAFNGPEPAVRVLDSAEEEVATIAAWLESRTQEGTPPEEIGIFVRSEAQVDRAKAALHAAGLEAVELDGGTEGASGRVAVGSMHLAKGLEFRAVVVAACDDDVIPLQSRIETIVDEADLEDVYNTERQLLYVACTRARDHLLVTGVAPGSEFLDDLRALRG